MNGLVQPKLNLFLDCMICSKLSLSSEQIMQSKISLDLVCTKPFNLSLRFMKGEGVQRADFERDWIHHKDGLLPLRIYTLSWACTYFKLPKLATR